MKPMPPALRVRLATLRYPADLALNIAARGHPHRLDQRKCHRSPVLRGRWRCLLRLPHRPIDRRLQISQHSHRGLLRAARLISPARWTPLVSSSVAWHVSHIGLHFIAFRLSICALQTRNRAGKSRKRPARSKRLKWPVPNSPVDAAVVAAAVVPAAAAVPAAARTSCGPAAAHQGSYAADQHSHGKLPTVLLQR